MNRLFLIALDLTNRICTIVGGGNVAYRKAKSFENTGAVLRIVAPQICHELVKDFNGKSDIRVKFFEPSDLDNSFLVVAATDDKALNSEIVAHCRERGILVNAVDQPEDCDFYFPAVINKDGVQIGISTGGSAPALAGWLKRELEKLLWDNLGEGLDIISHARNHLIELDPEGFDKRSRGFRDFFESDVWCGFLKGERKLSVEEVVRWILSSTE